MKSGAGCFLLGLGVFAAPLQALQLRGYQAAVHDRFTGFPSAPVMNPGFLHGAERFTGVGWYVPDTRRQFTLVTPRHFLCATHFLPVVGEAVRFVDSTGAVIERTVVAVIPVPNDTSGNSDISVGKLDADLPPTVTPLPWLNLAEEDAALGARIMAFGRFARGGNGVLAGLETLDETGISDTRCLYFIYRNASGDADDCWFEAGDSGSPCFATVNGMPALVGTNSAVGTDTGIVANFSAFVPHYASKIDAILAVDGAAMTPVFPSAAGLVTDVEPSPQPLRQLAAGSAVFTVRNPGSAAAGSISAVVTFGASAVPDNLDAPGWTVSGGGGSWTLERASLAPGGEVAFTVFWDIVPEVDDLSCSIGLTSDASPDAFLETAVEVAPSYAAWSQGLEEPGTDDDPDRDGVPNLIEYGLGGDPLSGGMELAPGVPALPVISHASAGSVSLVFPIRSDAELRGVSYVVEFSETLLEDSWSSEAPEGTEVSTEAWSPGVPGFAKRTVTWPSDAPRRFARLRVELAE